MRELLLLATSMVAGGGLGRRGSEVGGAGTWGGLLARVVVSVGSETGMAVVCMTSGRVLGKG